MSVGVPHPRPQASSHGLCCSFTGSADHRVPFTLERATLLGGDLTDDHQDHTAPRSEARSPCLKTNPSTLGWISVSTSTWQGLSPQPSYTGMNASSDARS